MCAGQNVLAGVSRKKTAHGFLAALSPVTCEAYAQEIAIPNPDYVCVLQQLREKQTSTQKDF
jgi:hypothetical protein